MHTINALLLPLCIAPLLLADARGAWLWAAVAVNGSAFLIESIDVTSEKTSRRDLGGLTRTEYWMHFAMSGLRWTHVGLAFAIHPASHFSGPASWEWLPVAWESPLNALAWGAMVLSLPMAALHVALLFRGRALVRAERALPTAQASTHGDTSSVR